MQKIKMPANLQKLIAMYDVPSNVVDMIEDYYSEVAHGMAQEVYENSQKEEETKERPFQSRIQEMARKKRLVR